MKCIVFDVDDTLYKRSQPFTRAAIDIFGGRYNLDWDELYHVRNIYSEEIFGASQSGEVTMEEMYEYRLSKALAHFGCSTTREEVLEFEKRYIYYQSLIQLDPPFESVFEKLTQMKIPMAVITNGPSEHQRHKINSLQLERWISPDRWIVSGDYAYAKPSLEIFRIAEQKLNAVPDDLIIVGDNYHSDIAGGIRAGWHTLWYNHVGEKASAFPEKATYECKTPQEIEHTLLELAEQIRSNDIK